MKKNVSVIHLFTQFYITLTPVLLLLAALLILLCACASAPEPKAPAASPALPAQSGQPAAEQLAEDQPAEDQPAAGQPATGAPFTFMFMSDTQADPETGDYGGFGAYLAQAIAAARPELLILGGDTVNDGADEDEWRVFHQAADPALVGLPVAAAAGNHDSKPLLAKQFDWPDTAPARPGQGWFYSFDMGGVHFTVLDSNIMGAANERDIAWLEANLSSDAASAADWRVAVCHHPFWPATVNPKDDARARTMRENFLPLLETYGVDLLLVGHQHNYARSLPMRGGEPAPQGNEPAPQGGEPAPQGGEPAPQGNEPALQGNEPALQGNEPASQGGEPALQGGAASVSRSIVQVMAASGGKASYTPEGQPYLALTAEAPNYVLLTASPVSLEIAAYDAEGAIIDTYRLTKTEEDTDG